MRALLLVALLSLSACSTRPCRDGTLLLDLQLPTGVTEARVEIEATYLSKTFTASIPSTRGGTVEVRFDEQDKYQTGQSIVIKVTAFVGAVAVALSSNTLTLSGSCLEQVVVLDGDLAPDLASEAGKDLLMLGGSDLAAAIDQNDSTDLTEAADLEAPVDLLAPVDLITPPDLAPVCSGTTPRCKPDDHRKQQQCVNGQWVDTPCAPVGGGTEPPKFACTLAKDLCIDTAWPQWNLKNPEPANRFTILPSTSPLSPNETMVFDALTGLTWQLKGTVAQQWEATGADAWCAGLTYGGYSGDWRVPSPAELNTIVDRKATSAPYVRAPFVNDTYNGGYVTSASVVPGTDRWVIGFSNARTGGVPMGSFAGRVRCVR